MDGKDLEIWMIVNLTNIFAKYASVLRAGSLNFRSSSTQFLIVMFIIFIVTIPP